MNCLNLSNGDVTMNVCRVICCLCDEALQQHAEVVPDPSVQCDIQVLKCYKCMYFSVVTLCFSSPLITPLQLLLWLHLVQYNYSITFLYKFIYWPYEVNHITIPILINVLYFHRPFVLFWLEVMVPFLK